MKGNPEQSIQFLSRYSPERGVALTAIEPDTGKITTKSFRPEKFITDAKAFIEKYLGKRNIYFNVNPLRAAVDKKASKDDVSHLAYLHIDVDPLAGKDLTAEQERILGSMKFFEDPRPTLVIFSGGGYQAFWKLKEPIKIISKEHAVELEGYNRQLELLFEADPCHNIDRIMRLPGTINVPDEKKKKKGRKPALAKVEWFDDSEYAIDQFVQAMPTEQVNSTTDPIELGNLPTVDLDGLNLPAHLKHLIIEAKDLEDGGRYESRSEALFAVVCSLVRKDLTNEQIASILMNREYKISESVLGQRNPEAYCIRQIRRGREFAVNPELLKLNDIHAVVKEAGRTRVITEEFDEARKRFYLTRSSFADFRNYYANKDVVVGANKKGKEITMKQGNWWLEHEKRRTYRNIVFEPGKETPLDYNLWRGFAVEDKPGEWGLFRGHILHNVCKGNQEHYDYLIKWMARAVQEPACPGEVAVIMRGNRGVGKSKFAKVFGHIFGQHYLHISNERYLTGNFNSHLRDCVLLFSDEAFWAGHKQTEGVLKMLITEENITIEAKGVDAINSPNYIHLIMASNNDWVVPAGSDERRYFVLDVGNKHAKDFAYFAAIDAQMQANGYEGMLHDLRAMDLTGFQVRNPPATEALMEQKVRSMNVEDTWWLQKLEDGMVLMNHSEWSGEAEKQALLNDYVEVTQARGITRRASGTELGIYLQTVLPASWPRTPRRMGYAVPTKNGAPIKEKRRLWYYQFPSLKECRAFFDKKFSMKYPWKDVEKLDLEPGEFDVDF